MNTRGEAILIGTVILIVVVLLSGGIVAYYTIQQTRGADASCLEALNSLEFNDVGFNCRMLDAPGGPLSSFSVKIRDDTVEGFQLGLPQAGTTDTVEIRAGNQYSNVCLLDSEFNTVLAIPSPGNTLTYVVRGDMPHVFIAPILKGGKGCYAEARKDVAIPNECVNPDVETRLAACLGGGGDGPRCGDGVINGNDVCDGNSRACTTTNGYPGTEACNAQCTGFNACTSPFFCGDGRVDGNEECDGGSSCDSTCHVELPPLGRLTGVSWLDTSVVEGDPANYTIEGANVANLQVEITIWEDNLNFPGIPDVLMTPDPIIATFDIAGSPIETTWIAVWINDYFGDPEYYLKVNLVNDPRTIESSWLNELTVTQRNPECGNNQREGTEVCDGSDVNGQTCQSQGFAGGTLQCTGGCDGFDTSQCTTNLCGNGIVDAGEQCDPAGSLCGGGGTCGPDCRSCISAGGDGSFEG